MNYLRLHKSQDFRNPGLFCHGLDEYIEKLEYLIGTGFVSWIIIEAMNSVQDWVCYID